MVTVCSDAVSYIRTSAAPLKLMHTHVCVNVLDAEVKHDRKQAHGRYIKPVRPSQPTQLSVDCLQAIAGSYAAVMLSLRS